MKNALWVITILLVATAAYYAGLTQQRDKAITEKEATAPTKNPYEFTQHATMEQDQVQAQASEKAHKLQDCIDSAKQDFATSYANLCNLYQTNQHQLDNPNWQCPLVADAGYPGSPYPAMVSKEQNDETLCATLYK